MPNDNNQNPLKAALDNLLDFGPEPIPSEKPEPTRTASERIRDIMKKIQEISQRIDDLSERY